MTSTAQQILDNFGKLSAAESDAVLRALNAVNEPKPLQIEISGPPGSGKTALGVQLAALLAQEGHDVFYYEGDHDAEPHDRPLLPSLVPPREGPFIPRALYQEHKREIVIRTKG